MTVSATLAPDNSGPARVTQALRGVLTKAGATAANPLVTTRQKLAAQEESAYSDAFTRIVGD